MLVGEEVLRALLREAVDQGQAPGIVAGVAHGGQVRVACVGAMAVDGPPMRRDTLFRISSMTKPMTAAVVLTLVRDGLLALDDPVQRHLPELADRKVLRRPDGPLDDTVPARRAFTVRDVLTFTWGMGMQGAMFTSPTPWPVCLAARELRLGTFSEPDPAGVPDPDTWLAGVAGLPLLAQPGERWLYQAGSQLLGVLAARVTGTPFDRLMCERLFEPVGMADTGFHTTDTDRLATAYQRVDGGLTVTDPPEGAWSAPPRFPDGGGGLLSTVDDVLAFGTMLLRGGGPVLSPEMVARMTANQLTDGQRAVWPGFDILSGRGWGYGVSVLDDGSYGWDGGLGTTWRNVPGEDLAVVVLTQQAWDESGPPAVGDAVLAAARGAVDS